MARHPGTRRNKHMFIRNLAKAVSHLTDQVNLLSRNLNGVAAGQVGLETILEVAGVLTPEVSEKAKPLIAARLSPPVADGGCPMTDAVLASRILTAAVYPETIELLDGTKVRTMDLALAVANDEHPGDDAIEPCWMRNCAVSGTNIAKLARMVTKAGGRIDLGPQVLPRVLNLYQDDILILAGCALRDMMGDAAPPIRIDDAALVLVLGALLFVARGGEDGQPPVGHRRGSDT